MKKLIYVSFLFVVFISNFILAQEQATTTELYGQTTLSTSFPGTPTPTVSPTTAQSTPSATTGTVGVDTTLGPTGTTPPYLATTDIGNTVRPDTYTNTNTGNVPISERDLRNCSIKPTLKNYCEGDGPLPSFVVNFFPEGNNVSVSGILSTIIQPEIVRLLQDHCVPGNWCLADSYHKKIAEGKDQFYANTPICRPNDLWDCLENIESYRVGCNEDELIFLLSTVSLLCDMEVIEGGRIGTDCYTRTVEALHVLYSDWTRNDTIAADTDMCKGYSRQIINTYGCVGMVCDSRERIFLTEFVPWAKTFPAALDAVDECQLKLQCTDSFEQQSPQQSPITPSTSNATSDESSASALAAALDKEAAKAADVLTKEIESVLSAAEGQTSDSSTPSGMTSTTNPFWGTTTPSQQNPFANDADDNNDGSEQSMDTPDGISGDDQAFLYGMVTVTVVIVMGLSLIGFMFFKRMRNRHYKKGYSQMTEEESKMLSSEYN